MRRSKILITISRLLFPFVFLFGIYIIINGDLSVGGGFQGGVILATSWLFYYFIKGSHPFELNVMLKIDKFLFVFLLSILFLSYFTQGEFYTNFMSDSVTYEVRRLYLVLLNLVIGFKVAFGFVALFFIFIEEGSS